MTEIQKPMTAILQAYTWGQVGYPKQLGVGRRYCTTDPTDDLEAAKVSGPYTKIGLEETWREKRSKISHSIWRQTCFVYLSY